MVGEEDRKKKTNIRKMQYERYGHIYAKLYVCTCVGIFEIMNLLK